MSDINDLVRAKKEFYATVDVSPDDQHAGRWPSTAAKLGATPFVTTVGISAVVSLWIRQPGDPRMFLGAIILMVVSGTIAVLIEKRHHAKTRSNRSSRTPSPRTA